MILLNSLWLETFVTLCEIGHFTRAAAVLNMTQPGVSQHIRKLEQQVGEPLLSKQGKSFIPTSAGDAVLAIGRRRREEERQLHSSLQQDDPCRGEVSVVCSGSMALLLYPDFIGLMTPAPDLRISVEATRQVRVIEGVVSGTYDLGITDQAPTHARLQGERVGFDPLCLLMPLGSPQPRSIADLDRLGFIAHPDGPAYADALLGINFPKDYPGAERLHQRSYVNQIGQIPEPIRQGLGYTILPKSGVDAWSGRAEISVIFLPEMVRQELWLINRKGRTLPARMQRVRTFIAEKLAAL